MLSIAFDDFAQTSWTEGGRVLRDHDVRATYYVCGALYGTVFAGQRMYGPGDLEAIHAAGHEIGCHTFDHESCLRRDGHDFERSIERNESFVRERVGDVPLVSFAYPYGDATIGAKRLAVRRFGCARGVIAGLNRRRLDLGQLKAVGLEESKTRIEAVEPYLDRAASSGAWLIVFTHDVQDRPSAYGCRPRDLDRLIRSARSARLEVLSVREALAARAGAPGGISA